MTPLSTVPLEVMSVGVGVWIAFIVSVIVMLIGVVGTVVPVLPGLPLVWLTMLVFGIIGKFERMDGTFLGIALFIVIVAEIADYATRAWGARRYGAGKAGAWGAIIGAFGGLFFLPVGLVLGPFLGALVAELLAGRTSDESIRAGWGGLIGTVGSIVIKITVAIGMTVAFIIKVL